MVLTKTYFKAVIMLMTLFLSSTSLSAHGYVLSPASRGYTGSLEKGTLGYSAAYAKYGSIINEPHSLEAPKGFPTAGPADGLIASAGGLFGGVLDAQTADRWTKTNISTGANNFLWKYTAYHATSKWHYYMTKQGWDPNKPLKRSDLELIGEVVNKNGEAAQDNSPHSITVPKNRQGYHIILAVWDVADTSNAFYNVIDVNVQSSTAPSTPPATPSGLTKISTSSTSAKIGWKSQTDAVSYNVFRDGSFIESVYTTEFNNQGLVPSTAYTYEIQAKNSAGILSAKSAPLSVKTDSASTPIIPEKPTNPTHLHSMGTTETSISLMWSASAHTQGIAKYEVFESGNKIGETTKTSFLHSNLSPDTQYKYTVKATAQNAQVSDFSNVLVAKTKAVDNGNGQMYCGAAVYNSKNAYPKAQTLVFYNCKIWKNKWYANPGELPGANPVWEEVSVCTESPNCSANIPVTYCGYPKYNPANTYAKANTKVFFEGKIWENKWYANPGEMPVNNQVWRAVSDCNEGEDFATKSNHKATAISIAVNHNKVIFSPETIYDNINKVEIINLGGVKILTSTKPNKENIDISNFQNGVYFVIITHKDGTITKKAIKK